MSPHTTKFISYLSYILFIISFAVFFYSIGRAPFLDRRKQNQVVLTSLSILLLILVYLLSSREYFSDIELVLFPIVAISSFALGFLRKYNRGSILYQSNSIGLISVEENKSESLLIMKRDNKTLSGINTQTLQPTSKVLWYPHLCELFPVRPKKILCVGGGACAYPIFAASKDKALYIDIVEIDPKVIEAAEKFFPIPKNNRVKLINADGINWIQENTSKYDLIFVDVGITLYRKKYTFNDIFVSEKMLKNYAKHLDNKGTIIFNIITTRKNVDKKLILSKLKSFAESFKSFYTFQANTRASVSDRQDIIYFFSRQHVTTPKLLDSLTFINSRKLSYPKEVYKNLLRSSIKF